MNSGKIEYRKRNNGEIIIFSEGWFHSSAELLATNDDGSQVWEFSFNSIPNHLIQKSFNKKERKIINGGYLGEVRNALIVLCDSMLREMKDDHIQAIDDAYTNMTDGLNTMTYSPLKIY